MDSKPFWMKALADEYPAFAERCLAEISIPGSHDSASHNIHAASPLAPDSLDWVRSLAAVAGQSVVQSYYAPWSKCQNYGIFTQLLNGIRYLDLRVCFVNNELWCCHAQISVAVSEVLAEIKQFITEVGVDEVLLLDFNHFYDMDRDSHARLCHMIQSAFGDKICLPSERTTAVTLSDIWNTQQRIIVLYNNPVEVASYPWLWYHRDLVSSPWHNTPDTDVLLQRMSDQWQRWVVRPSFDKFTITQTQCSPNSTLVTSNFFKLCASVTVKCVEDMAKVTQPPVCEWLANRRKLAPPGSKWTGVNIAIADFVDVFDGKWIDAVISLNLPEADTK
ncbi:PI-PLC X domain-containing protein 3-like [Sycon ciliatum]|uniref:PI-PLC X domain-containing protein 3-like n=1 Tax=Sycon ciliatum TaxID=27933 RepID=UPI0031F62266|eukprot:scpid21544/ scgid15495/ PI-PLC X domain-containing protein 3